MLFQQPVPWPLAVNQERHWHLLLSESDKSKD